MAQLAVPMAGVFPWYSRGENEYISHYSELPLGYTSDVDLLSQSFFEGSWLLVF